MSNNILMEQWKTNLLQDAALNKLFDENLNQDDFVYLLLRDCKKSIKLNRQYCLSRRNIFKTNSNKPQYTSANGY